MMGSKRRPSKSCDPEDPAPSASKIKRRSSNKKRKDEDEAVQNGSLFVQILKSAGMTLKSGEQQNELDVDQMLFQKTLQQTLKKHAGASNVPEEFMAGLESHIEDRERFRNCLLPCGRSNNEEEGNPVFSSFHDSLIKILLSMESLQGPLINLLFEKMPEYLYDSVGSDGISIPRLIINQLKWLDLVVSSKELTSKIMELVVVSPADIQQHIISSLPEILEDSEHNDVAKELSSLLQKNSQLTVAILDTFSSLNLNAELLTEVRHWVMSTLSAVDLDVVPVIVKFVLHTVTPTDAAEVIAELRHKLDVESCIAHLPSAKVSSSKAADGGSHDCVTILTEVIKSAVWFQKHVCEAWIKAIEGVSNADEHKVTDFLVLVILYSTNPTSKKQVERVMRNKIRHGFITSHLLHSAFTHHTPVLMVYFPSILSLAQTLLRSPEPEVASFSRHLYKLAFSAFDRYCQQELVATLVTHVCSGYSGEVDSALDIIVDLVCDHAAVVVLYAVFIKGILDYLDNLNTQQIRKLFQILCMLAFIHEGAHIQDEMHIVIRKQLSSTAVKYKRIGVIGAVRMLGSMAATDRRRSGCGTSEAPALSPHVFRQASSLLELARSCCDQCPEAAAFYYDELANLVQRRSLHPQIMEFLRKSVVDDFQDDYVVDLDLKIEGTSVFPVKAMYNLEEDESQGIVVINLLPLLSHDFTNKGPAQTAEGRLVSPLCLSPFFRLLRLCIQDEYDGNLDEIDALLGCPVYVTDLDVVDKVESLSRSERDFLCSLLFFTINWFREVINAFCMQPNADMKGKVLTRLQNITWLQTLLEKCLAESPGFAPPPANFDSDQQEIQPNPNMITGPAKRARKGKKRRLADTKNSCAEGSQMEEPPPDTEKSQAEKEPEVTKPSINLSSFGPFFRELDLEVFTVLHSGLLTRSLLDSEMCTKATEVVQLGPAELVFLLEDLSHKMERALVATKRSPLMKVKGSRNSEFSHLQQKTSQEVVQFVVQLLNPLCNHMENTHNYFQTLLTVKHGVADALGIDLKEHHYMSRSYQLLLQVFHALFAWSGFSQLENRALLKEALGILVGRLKEKDAELTIEELVSQSFSYVQNLCSSVPNIHCALCVSQLLTGLVGKSADAQPYHDKIAAIVKRFLCQSWVKPNGERERGLRFNEDLHSLLCMYVQHTDVLKAVEDVCSVGVSELTNTTKDGYSSTYPTLSRQTFGVYFRVLMENLEKYVRNIPAGNKSDSLQAQADHLLQWSLAVRNFHILVNLIKVFDSRPILSICLKYGRLFVETFLKVGMPLLDCSFKKHKDTVQNLLKILQLCTRQLHHMCGHSKILQDAGLTSHVPLLKKSLEMFVYRVKAMLTLNNCQEAFWLGNLKNRDLQGEEILSQNAQESDEEEQVSQLPAEEPEAAEEEASEEEEEESEEEGEESD